MGPFDDWVAEFEVVVEAVGPRLVRLDDVDRVTELERPTRFDFLIAILRPRYFSLLIRKKLPITTSAPPRHQLRRDAKPDHSHSACRKCHIEFRTSIDLDFLLEFSGVRV